MQNLSLLEITLFQDIELENGEKNSEKCWALVSHKISDESYHIKIIPMFSYRENQYIISPYEAIEDNDGQANNLSVQYINGKLNFKNMIIISPESLRGHDLASYCMREIIFWSKERFSSDTIIEGLTLHDLGAECPENLLRRNWNDPQRVDTFLFVDLVYLGRLVQRTGEVNATEIYRRV